MSVDGRPIGVVEKMVAHPWGRTTLVASQLTRAFACHYPRPFFDLMDAVGGWFATHFDDIHTVIGAEDRTYLIKKSTHFAKADMVALFFPVCEKHFHISSSLLAVFDWRDIWRRLDGVLEDLVDPLDDLSFLRDPFVGIRNEERSVFVNVDEISLSASIVEWHSRYCKAIATNGSMSVR